ncbi:hypothetical protein [Alteribacillus sp. HJP-4]
MNENGLFRQFGPKMIMKIGVLYFLLATFVYYVYYIVRDLVHV